MDTDTKQWLVIIVIMLIVLSIVGGTAFIVENSMKISIEKVRTKIKKYLYKKYGEEFVVDSIGTRKDNGRTEYVARIYPKSIVGTSKEGDEYYYARASVDKLSFGKLEEPGDSYSYVMMNKTGEEYLMPKAKEIFGDRILLKVDSELKIWGREEIIVEEYKEKGSEANGVDAFIGYKESDFKEARKRMIKDPQNNKLLLDLEVYIFNKIEDKAEKEKRRKQIFRFVQYLKEKRLFRYLEMRVVVVDKRVLAPNYEKFETEIELSKKVEKKIEEEEETVHLPPMKLRKKMSRKLQQEVKRMSEEELLSNMRKIKKEDLNYDELSKWNSHYFCWVYSKGMVKEKISTSLEENEELVRGYDEISDVKMGPNLEYVYVN